MRRKITNPYNPQINKCFGCSTSNPIGLKLKFEEIDEHVVAEWEPEEYYQGYINVLHGGIIATMLDEVAAWCVTVKTGTAGVTTELKVKYLKPVFMNKGKIRLRARVVKTEGRYVNLKCELMDSSDKICAESETLFFTYPEDVAKRKFGYPGQEKFFG